MTVRAPEPPGEAESSGGTEPSGGVMPSDPAGPPPAAGPTGETGREQAYVTRLYARLDALRAETRARLSAVLRETGGTPQARSERDAASGESAAKLTRLGAAENGLCFGRLDLRDGSRLYVGRIGLQNEDRDGDPLLIDWRAPAARFYYVATSAAPGPIHRRRHIIVRGRRVIRLDDEVLDGAMRGRGPGNGPGGGSADDGGEVLAGEAALLAALNAGRSGRMQDVVATLQAEQDAIIRSEHRGVLVVQGGPGTGKTAVALHRAAYLLYNRPRLATAGVLVVGPTPTFLTYISQVLPGLGETSVLLSTVAELFPGVTATRPEPPATAALKGRGELAGLLAAAVRDRQVPAGAGLRAAFGDEVLTLDPAECLRAADRARATALPHNLARLAFRDDLITLLAADLAASARRLDESLEAEVAGILAEAGVDSAIAADLARLEGVPGPYDGEGAGPESAGGLEGALSPYDEYRAESVSGGGAASDEAELRPALDADPVVGAALDALWPGLTPQRLLTELFADPARLARAADGLLTPAEQALLVRRPGGWTAADVPLLDEAAELLGSDERAERARAAAAYDQEAAYAQGVLDLDARARSGDGDDGDGDDHGESERLTAADLLDAGAFADRHRAARHGTVAERAAADRTWAFGHLIVDEAQELSAMDWRLLMRRCPSRSMTLVGDIAQTSGAAGATSWDEALRPHVGDRWRPAGLTVNYRTPAEIMTVAAAYLAPGLEPPKSVRSTGVPPERLTTTADALPALLAALTRRAAAALTEGRLAVIVPDHLLPALAPTITAACPTASHGPAPDLTSPVVLLGARQSKGLEFDTVLLADPTGILRASPRGANDLYVALTRATQRLTIVEVAETAD